MQAKFLLFCYTDDRNLIRNKSFKVNLNMKIYKFNI